MSYKAFISYSHNDEYLKDEFIAHCAPLARAQRITVWHDRLLLAGDDFADEIDENLANCQLFFMLISADFISSDYCYSKEYMKAKELSDAGKTRIIPILVRSCDINSLPFSKGIIIPTDATPVNPSNASRAENGLRDTGWTDVIKNIKLVLDDIDKDTEPFELNSEYRASLEKKFQVDAKTGQFDVDRVFVEPEISYERTNVDKQLTKNIYELSKSENIIISGDDSSGKSLLLSRLQNEMAKSGVISVVINGREIKNLDIEKLITSRLKNQIPTVKIKPNHYITVILDDLDECRLKESLTLKVLDKISKQYSNLILSCFSSAFGESFASRLGIDFVSGQIQELPVNKVYDLLGCWLSHTSQGNPDLDAALRKLYPAVMRMTLGGAVPFYPSNILTLLRVIDIATGADVSTSSNAACYDQLLTLKLIDAGVQANRIDSIKNFLGLIAGECFKEADLGSIDNETFHKIAEEYKRQYLTDISEQSIKVEKSGILLFAEGKVSFCDKFLGYLLVGRYLEKIIKQTDRQQYDDRLLSLLENLRYRAHANILIYCVYFSNDDQLIIDFLIDRVNQKFHEVSNEEILHTDLVYFERSTEIAEALSIRDEGSRIKELSDRFVPEEVRDLAEIPDPYNLSIDRLLLSDESFDERFLNDTASMFRAQSVLANALNCRQGTFQALQVHRCVEAILNASRRYAKFNVHIANLALSDLNKTLNILKDRYADEDFGYTNPSASKIAKVRNEITAENLDQFVDIHGRQLPFVSMSVAGRILGHENTLMSLEGLNTILKEKGQHSLVTSMVAHVARLYKDVKLNREEITSIIDEYGEKSAVADYLRYVYFLYSRFMPIDDRDQQWLNKKLKVKLSSMRFNQRKMLPKHEVIKD